MDVLEFRLPRFEEGFYLDVCSYAQMGSEEGLVVAGSNCIKLRENVMKEPGMMSGGIASPHVMSLVTSCCIAK